MAAKYLIPLGLLGGVGVAVAVAVAKAKKAKASPLEAKPQAAVKPTPAVTPAMVIEEYNRAMHPDVQDVDYLKRAAAFLDENGQPAWAAAVRTKISAIQASKGAAMAQAQADVAKQAATPPAVLEQGKAQFEQALGKRPTQAEVDKMYDWAMKPETGSGPNDLAPLQQAYQMVIAYDTSPQKGVRQTLLGDKLAKVKAGVYSPLAETTAIPKAGALAPTVVKAGPVEEEVEVPPEAEVEEEEPKPGKELPPLPPKPSPPPTIPTAPVPPPSTEVPELAKEETSAPADPNRTIALARALIEVEDEPGWKKQMGALVKNWQKKVGLTADGKFGPGSAMRMAQEVGVLPLIRYWPLGGTGTKAGNLEEYRTDLYAFADKLDAEGKKAHAEAIRASAEHEKGQGWPKSPGPVVAADGSPARVEMLDKLLTGLANAEFAE